MDKDTEHLLMERLATWGSRKNALKCLRSRHLSGGRFPVAFGPGAD